MTSQTTLQDREPSPWKAERQPDLSRSEHRLGNAARRFGDASNAVEQHVLAGLRQGPEYQALLDVRDLRWEELCEAAWGFPAGDGRKYGEGQP